MPSKAETELLEKLEAMLKTSRQPAAGRQALGLLFPKTAGLLDTLTPSVSNPGERKRRHQISARDYSAAYFQLDPEMPSWGRSEIDAILAGPSPQESLDRAEQRISAAPEDARGKLRRQLLEALDGIFDSKIPFNEQWLLAIVDKSPTFIAARDRDDNQLFANENFDRLRWVIVSGLRDLDPAERARLLLSVIASAGDLSLLCDVIRMATGDMRPDGAEDREEKLGLGTDRDNVRLALLERVRTAATSGQIWDQARPAEILWFWWGCRLDDEVRSCTSAALSNEGWASALLNAMISEVRSSAGDYERVNRESYSKIADLELAVARAKELQHSTNAPVRTVADRFLKAIENDRSRGFSTPR
jgi:hypothetical protein